MTTALSAAAVLIVRALRLGPLRLTAYGACAAAGLVLGLSFARRCARWSQLPPEPVWDAGLFAIFACLVSSRLLLVLRDPKAFVRYPLLLLGLPSLTLLGVAFAGVMVWVYLRRAQLAVLPMLDVFAVPAAVLASLLELGHALDGSEIGMPSTVPWAVPDPWTAGAERVHPVALYGVGLSLLIAAMLWWALARGSRLHAGQIGALGLFFGGLAAFGLDMLTLPVPAIADLGIEPGQWIALATVTAGAVIWVFAPGRSSLYKAVLAAEDEPGHAAVEAGMETR